MILMTIATSVAITAGITALRYGSEDFSQKIGKIERENFKKQQLQKSVKDRIAYISKNKEIIKRYMRYRIDVEETKKIVAKGFDAINGLGYISLNAESVKENPKFYNCADIIAKVSPRYEFLTSPLTEHLGVEFAALTFDVVENPDYSVPGKMKITIRKKIKGAR